jgi:hypothetical protein
MGILQLLCLTQLLSSHPGPSLRFFSYVFGCHKNHPHMFIGFRKWCVFMFFLIIDDYLWLFFDYCWLLMIIYVYLCFFKWFFMIVSDYSWLFVWLFMIVWCWFTIIDPKAWRFSWGKPAVRSFFQAWHRRSTFCVVGSLGRCVTWEGLSSGEAENPCWFTILGGSSQLVSGL